MQYKQMLRPKFDASGHSLTFKQVHQFMLFHDRQAKKCSAKNVLRRLRGTNSLSDEQQALLLQGYVKLL
eukprot:6005905-Pleurochrysis_carterae.AAC.1